MTFQHPMQTAYPIVRFWLRLQVFFEMSLSSNDIFILIFNCPRGVFRWVFDRLCALFHWHFSYFRGRAIFFSCILNFFTQVILKKFSRRLFFLHGHFSKFFHGDSRSFTGRNLKIFTETFIFFMGKKITLVPVPIRLISSRFTSPIPSDEKNYPPKLYNLLQQIFNY